MLFITGLFTAATDRVVWILCVLSTRHAARRGPDGVRRSPERAELQRAGTSGN